MWNKIYLEEKHRIIYPEEKEAISWCFAYVFYFQWTDQMSRGQAGPAFPYHCMENLTQDLCSLVTRRLEQYQAPKFDVCASGNVLHTGQTICKTKASEELMIQWS